MRSWHTCVPAAMQVTEGGCSRGPWCNFHHQRICSRDIKDELFSKQCVRKRPHASALASTPLLSLPAAGPTAERPVAQRAAAIATGARRALPRATTATDTATVTDRRGAPGLGSAGAIPVMPRRRSGGVARTTGALTADPRRARPPAAAEAAQTGAATSSYVRPPQVRGCWRLGVRVPPIPHGHRLPSS